MSLVDFSANPFASHRTHPGAIPFQFPAETSAASLVAQLRDNHYHGQIVGPHGSGKSTLLATLLPEIEAQGVDVRSIALHDGQRGLPTDFLRRSSVPSPSMLVIDGYEQLSIYSRTKLRWHCWRQRCGLLVTAHSQVARLPVLISLAPTLELMRELLDRLLAAKKGTFYFLIGGHRGGRGFAQKVECPLFRFAEFSFRRHGGNLREVWFDLYDRHERQERARATCRVLPQLEN